MAGKRVSPVLAKRISILCSVALLLIVCYFFLAPTHLAPSDEKLNAKHWPDRAGRLRQRSNYHDWQGSSSEWMKRSFLGRFLFVFFDGDVDPAKTEMVKRAMQRLAGQQWKEAFNFVTVPNRQFLTSFVNIVGEDFTEAYWPGALVLDVGEGFKKFHAPMGPILQTNVTEFEKAFPKFVEEDVMERYFNKEMKPYLRNEQIEVEDYEDELHNIKHINSTFFHSILLRGAAEREFMVLFYAPWCGHCRRFESRFAPLVSQIRRGTKKIGFYKMDATKNDVSHPELSLTRVPYIRFFKGSDMYRQPIAFDHRAEKLELDTMKQFFGEHSEFSMEVNKIAGEEL